MYIAGQNINNPFEAVKKLNGKERLFFDRI